VVTLLHTDFIYANEDNHAVGIPSSPFDTTLGCDDANSDVGSESSVVIDLRKLPVNGMQWSSDVFQVICC
jgi:hypothetical protein